MSDRPKVLVQLDSDPQSSVFDGVVAVDAGVDHLFRHANVMLDEVRDLVYGVLFTRGGVDLKSTAIFIGGSDVPTGQRLLRAVLDTFFGPVRVSVMFDASGANTTSAAAVLAAERHIGLEGKTALVLGATGPVGQRVVRLLARRGAAVRVASRQSERAQAVVHDVEQGVPGSQLSPVAVHNAESLRAALVDTQLVVGAGAAGVRLLPCEARRHAESLRVLIDLNAVPPTGIEEVDVADRAAERGGVFCYGAIGVGTTKMKIHKAAVRRLFEAADLVLDAEEIYEIGRELD